LNVSDKIVEAAAKKKGNFTLADWKANANGLSNLSANISVAVKQGEVIGLTGGQRYLRAFGSTDTSGPHSTGPHLHLELIEIADFNDAAKKTIQSCGACRATVEYPKAGLAASVKSYDAYLAEAVDTKYKSPLKASS